MSVTLRDDLNDPQVREMMGRGKFAQHHTWESESGWRVEYWRGTERNGACIRAYDELRRNIWIRHDKTPGAALQWLRGAGYPVPGLPS